MGATAASDQSLPPGWTSFVEPLGGVTYFVDPNGNNTGTDLPRVHSSEFESHRAGVCPATCPVCMGKGPVCIGQWGRCGKPAVCIDDGVMHCEECKLIYSQPHDEAAQSRRRWQAFPEEKKKIEAREKASELDLAQFEEMIKQNAEAG